MGGNTGGGGEADRVAGGGADGGMPSTKIARERPTAKTRRAVPVLLGGIVAGELKHGTRGVEEQTASMETVA